MNKRDKAHLIIVFISLGLLALMFFGAGSVHCDPIRDSARAKTMYELEGDYDRKFKPCTSVQAISTYHQADCSGFLVPYSFATMCNIYKESIPLMKASHKEQIAVLESALKTMQVRGMEYDETINKLMQGKEATWKKILKYGLIGAGAMSLGYLAGKVF